MSEQEPEVITQEMGLFVSPNEYAEKGYVYLIDRVSYYNPKGWKLIKTWEDKVEIPADFDPIQAAIEGLEAERREIFAEASKKGDEIQERIRKLQALEYQPEKDDVVF